MVTIAATGENGRVVTTEHEPPKAAKTREYWEECGELVSGIIDLPEGNLRETLEENL